MARLGIAPHLVVAEIAGTLIVARPAAAAFEVKRPAYSRVTFQVLLPDRTSGFAATNWSGYGSERLVVGSFEI